MFEPQYDTAGLLLTQTQEALQGGEQTPQREQQPLAVLHLGRQLQPLAELRRWLENRRQAHASAADTRQQLRQLRPKTPGQLGRRLTLQTL